MQTRSPKILLTALACGAAFVLFRIIAAPPDNQSTQTQSPADSTATAAAPAPAPGQPPVLLAQAATPPQIGAVGGGNAGAGAAIAPEHTDWKLVWEDDFSKDNGQIDPKKWSHVVGGGGFGNHESEFYTDDPKNSQIQNGVLVMTALREDKGTEKYTSAKLWTKGLYSVEYGRIEACIKAPSAQAGNWIWEFLGSSV